MGTRSFGRNLLGVSFSIVIVFLFLACGASRQTSDFEGDEIDLDELLGEEQTSTADHESEEAEVLRLLGISPVENEPPQTDSATIAQEEQSSSEDEVALLKEELDRKDREISKLRSELTQKEAEISSLETKARMPVRLPAPVGRSGKSGRPATEFKSRYESGLNQFYSKNYQEALTLFRDLLLSDPSNSLSDNCQYWIGECYYGLGSFEQAIVEFEKVFSFPNSNKSDDAQLKLGVCYLKLGDKQQARSEFDRLLSNYPDSEYVSLAQRYLARL